MTRAVSLLLSISPRTSWRSWKRCALAALEPPESLDLSRLSRPSLVEGGGNQAAAPSPGAGVEAPRCLRPLGLGTWEVPCWCVPRLGPKEHALKKLSLAALVGDDNVMEDPASRLKFGFPSGVALDPF